MGRMTKQGIDYFSLDVQFEDKVELYLLEKEAVGLAVFITLLQIIYQNEGYYTTNGKDLQLLIKKRINVSINDIEDCINVMIQRDVLNKKYYKKYKILTSSGIQKRYFDAAKRKKVVRVIKDFLLISVNEYENIKYVDINDKNVGGNATKEEEEEKVKEDVKEEEDIKNIWNTFAKENNLNCIRDISDQRRKHIHARLKEEPFNLYKIFDAIKESDFLLGKKKDWKVDFDFVFGSTNNYLKILEGKYKNGRSDGSGATPEELANIVKRRFNREQQGS